MSRNRLEENKLAPVPSAGQPRVLVLGAGNFSAFIVQALEELGAAVTRARIRSPYSVAGLPLPPIGIEGRSWTLSHENCVDIEEAPIVHRLDGRFVASLGDGPERAYDCVVLAPEVALRPVPGPLAEHAELFAPSRSIESTGRYAFLMDYQCQSDPFLGMAAIEAAADNVSSGGESVVCFRHVPVNHLIGEGLYDGAKRAGVRFARYGDALPMVSSDDVGLGVVRTSLAWKDVIDGGHDSVFLCDKVFVVTGCDESSIPSWTQGIPGHGDLDSRGFALSDSVHSSAGYAFASGVFVVGEATGGLDTIRLVAQARAAAASAYVWMRSSRLDNRAIRINNSCARCLTCYRVCPHGAVTLRSGTSNPPVQISPALCRSCGLCVSLCPRMAIELNVNSDGVMVAAVGQIPPGEVSRTAIVFGCERSAHLLESTCRVPECVKFVRVPCAGRVSEYLIWHTLAAGAGSVLVVGCHHGNCASNTGTDNAALRVRKGLATGLFDCGPRKLGYATVAPNEPARFERLLWEWAEGTQRQVP